MPDDHRAALVAQTIANSSGRYDRWRELEEFVLHADVRETEPQSDAELRTVVESLARRLGG